MVLVAMVAEQEDFQDRIIHFNPPLPLKTRKLHSMSKSDRASAIKIQCVLLPLSGIVGNVLANLMQGSFVADDV
ncbi:MAG: hypothetical protein BRC48_15475 [Cyanobacteria bacterium QS_9_48_30]|nr:MAG: hypothetical protein BRC48_15475 [Cyanobacteria bacterium QS_9_48_30]